MPRACYITSWQQPPEWRRATAYLDLPPIFATEPQREPFQGPGAGKAFRGQQGLLGHEFRDMVEDGDIFGQDIIADLERGHPRPRVFLTKIGRASCRERVCQYVLISVVAVALTKKHMTYKITNKIQTETNKQDRN